MIEALIFIACILGVALLFGVCVFGPEAIEWNTDRRKRNREIAAGTHGMSKVSKQIIFNYERLPEDNRPFGDIKPVLRALDTAHEPDKVDYHFSARNYMFEVSCFCGHYETPCEYNDYREIAQTISGIKTAIKEQAKALALAGVVHELEMVNELKESLLAEQNAILSVTKELA